MISSAHSLLSLDALVFSSHKTSTQTLVNTLRGNGISATHAHSLTHLGAKRGGFQALMRNYLSERNTKLRLYTVFREPIERLISSFFQTYGSDLIDFGYISSTEESILYSSSMSELQDMFAEVLEEQTLPGYPESLGILCEELSISPKSLSFDADKGVSLVELDECDLVLLRFDLLIAKYSDILSSLCGVDVEIDPSNLSRKKWYSSIYQEFTTSLCVPPDTMDALYEEKIDLLEVFYGDGVEDLKASVKERYSGQR